MSKKKRRKRKRGKKDDELKNKFSKKEEKGKRKKIRFELDKEDVPAKNVIDDVIDKLKSARKKIKTKSKLNRELVFARDILDVINEVVTRYDRALTDGTFSTSPVAQYLFQALNYMLAAYNNIEKLLMERAFNYLDEYYDVRFTQTGKISKNRPQMGKLKHGRSGKIHIPLLNKERKKRATKKMVEKERRKKKGGKK